MCLPGKTGSSGQPHPGARDQALLCPPQLLDFPSQQLSQFDILIWGFYNTGLPQKKVKNPRMVVVLLSTGSPSTMGHVLHIITAQKTHKNKSILVREPNSPHCHQTDKLPGYNSKESMRTQHPSFTSIYIVCIKNQRCASGNVKCIAAMEARGVASKN